MGIIFKVLDESLLEWARDLHNDPEVLGMLSDSHEVSKSEQKLWFSRLLSSSSSKRLVAFNDNSDPVGLVRIDYIDITNKSVCVGLDIHKDFRGWGYAKLIYREIFKDWFGSLKFNRIWLTTAEYNKRAIHVYKSLGFKEEGRQRKALRKNGAFYDCIIMSILLEEYKDD